MIDMSDFTFCIPCKIDTPERQENLRINLEYMTQNVKATYLVGELDEAPKAVVLKHPSVQHIFTKSTESFFYRTRLLNSLFTQSKTSFVVNYDLDVLIPLSSWKMTATLLRTTVYSFVYPYNGIFYFCPRTYIDGALKACTEGTHLFSKDFLYAGHTSYGGAVAASRKDYLAMGGENENFKSWGCEDWERMCRWQALQYRWTRVSAPEAVLYHMNHPMLADSSKGNPYYTANENEYFRLQRMTTEEMQAHVNSWSWKKGLS